MEDCLFCKIIKGEVPSYKIYEDEFTYAFLDISNDANGHILVVPKKHSANLLDSNEIELAHVMSTVKLISNHLVNKCGFDGVNVLNANGESAEQSVFHLHIHIIPRKNGDNLHVFPTLSKNKESLDEICKRLKIEQ